MNFLVTGVFTGKNKENGNNFYVVHVVEIDRKINGLKGYQTGKYYCTEEVAKTLEPNCVYELRSEFGRKNICEAIFVRDNGE